MISMNNIIKVMSPVKAYYTVVYWSRILSLPIYYNTLDILYILYIIIIYYIIIIIIYIYVAVPGRKRILFRF